jgi:enoyl-CoA hydratase/carnithine racemase
LTWELVQDLRAAVAAARADRDVRVVVLAGAGERAFCSGVDLGGMASGAGPLELHEARGELAALFQDLWHLGKPTIARVQGFALAGGFGLALACDLVVAADDATFGAPEVDVGLWPHLITVPLTRSMPPKVALELMLTGRRVPAGEARELGFVTRLVPAASLDGAVAELAGALAAKSPAVLALGLASFHAVWDLAAADALRLLHPMLSVTAATEDAAEGTTAFAERRPPVWRGR